MGPEMMQEFRDQAERFGARFITDNVTSVEPGADGEPHTVWVDDERVQGPHRRSSRWAPSTRSSACPARRSSAAAASPTARPATPPSSRSATTIIVGGGDSAMEEAIFLAKFSSKVDDRAPARRVPRLEDHARARPRDREHRVPDARTSSRSSWPARTARSDRARLRNTETGETRELPMTGAFIAIGHEPQSEIVDGHRRHRRRGLRHDRGQVDAHERARRLRRRRPRRPHLPPGGHRRRLRLPGRARRRVVPARQPERADARPRSRAPATSPRRSGRRPPSPPRPPRLTPPRRRLRAVARLPLRRGGRRRPVGLTLLLDPFVERAHILLRCDLSLDELAECVGLCRWH